MIHECGHLIAMNIVNVKTNRIVFYGAGIKILPENRRMLSFKEDLFILSGGCLLNFISIPIFLFLGRNNDLFCFFAILNLITGLFNIIPLKNFDGGKIIDLIIERYCPHNCIRFLKMLIKIIYVFLIIFVSIILFRNSWGNVTFIITVVYFIISTIFM